MLNPKATIRLKAGANPATISGWMRGANGKRLAFPTLIRQQNGWNSKTPREIVQCYPDIYVLVKPSKGV